jgi:hypothetical protein
LGVEKGCNLRRWGILITAFYALVVIGLLVPAGVLLFVEESIFSKAAWSNVRDTWGFWLTWIPIAVFVCGEAMLLFISVDATQKRLSPRASVKGTVAIVGILLALLTFCAAFSIGAAVQGDKFGDSFLSSLAVVVLGSMGLLWAFWGIIFYRYARGGSNLATRAVSWLLKGSVLELLIAVPCHIVVRRRHDCSAPIATSFGITTGIAIMLLSFGPSILFLYKKRLDSYANRGSGPRHLAPGDTG